MRKTSSLHYQTYGRARADHTQDILGTIILLHGYGSNEEDLFGLAPFLARGDTPILSVRAPLSIGPDIYAWFPLTGIDETLHYASTNVLVARETLGAFLDTLPHKKSGERSIVLIGFSQGGALALDAALTRTDIRAAVCLSGLLLPETQQIFDGNAAPPPSTPPIFIGHGTRDTVLSARHARDATKFLTEQKIAVDHHEYPTSHGITPSEIQDVTGWIDSHMR